MIYLFSGTPGSGKSYDATREIYEKLNRPHPKLVVCNYDLSHDMRNYEYYRYVPNDRLTPELLVQLANEWWSTHTFHEDGILLVLDECQLLFNSREWARSDRMGFLEFMSQHRHHGYTIILIAQSDKMIDRQFRALIEYETVHRKLANFGIGGKILSLVTMGNTFGAITRYYGLNERLGVRMFVPRKKILRLYDSYSTFKRTEDSGAGGGIPPEGPAPRDGAIGALES